MERALVVEDDQSWQEILAEILTDSGLAVDVAAGLEAAVTQIVQGRHRLAVVDLSLEGDDGRNRDGLQVLDALRRGEPGCAAILLTGFATADLEAMVLGEYGASACLDKGSFRRTEFRKIVREVL